MEYIQAICNLYTFLKNKIQQRKKNNQRQLNIVVVSQYLKTIHPAMGVKV